ncbi:hypothetical protein HPB49_007841 [Dermacentor silvarum]|uniref:Uncharacterized protein n=1 Tax=Dermacentor silvarum TaxID=543639 RepID=A0ACB8C875_DERSI|nr:hypothetical protein HPB49_007841 [Dermacentor silvarum]
MKGELSVKTRFRRGATIATAQRLLQRYCDEAGKSERLVILHAGVSDANKSAEPTEVAQMVRERIIPYAAELVICSVPENTLWGKEAQARAMLLNTELKRLGTSESAKFLDLSEAVQGEGRLAQDGIHYLAKTSRKVATEVTELIHPFLGATKRGQRCSRRRSMQDMTWRQERPMVSTTASTASVEPRANQTGDWRTPTQGMPAGIPAPEQPPPPRQVRELIPQFPPAPKYAGIQANSGYPTAAGSQHWGYRYGPPMGPLQCATPPPGPLRQMLNLYPGTDLFRMWTRRVHHLKQKNGLIRDPILAESIGAYAKAVQQRVRDVEEVAWQLALAQKETLSFYRQHKSSIKATRLYDNSVGSALLFEARAGALRTLTRQRAFDTTVTCVLCRSCGKSDETIEHLVLQCDELGESVSRASLAVALGFDDSEGEVQAVEVSRTKRRLEQWRTATQQCRRLPTASVEDRGGSIRDSVGAL